MSEDLKRERASATFNVCELTDFYNGDASATRRKRYLVKKLLSDPAFEPDAKRFLWSREKRYDNSIRMCVALAKFFKDNNINQYKVQEYFWLMSAVGEVLPIELHFSMWTSAILDQGTEKQHQKWLPLTENCKVIGTYAQTEIGHGTFIRGLETTATYCPKTQEFIMNSPTLTSYKWWPGGLGKTATHAIVVAQLVIRGKSYGIHLFIVQLRSLEDHMPLSGITVGDIGNKLAYDTMDNGFLKLDSVPIPRENMLMRYAEVTPDGSYRKPENVKVAYASMTLYRTQLLFTATGYMAKTCTIAIRYSAIRRQCESKPKGNELQILDYKTQQYKLFPHVATTYALHCAATYVMRLYKKISSEIGKGNLLLLSELHGFSSGLKAIATEFSTASIEECRRSCGGHGFSAACGIGHIYRTWVAACTYEGDNTVMYLQCARFLLKCFRNPDSASENNSYMRAKYKKGERWQTVSSKDLKQSRIIIYAYEHRARRMLTDVARLLDKQSQDGISSYKAWRNTGIRLVNAARAHMHYFLVRNFFATVAELKQSPAVTKILESLSFLFALYGIDRFSGEFLQDHFMDTDQTQLIHSEINQLLEEIRPNIVAIVDAFDIPDEALLSVMGRYDGNDYELMLNWAQESILNKSQVHQSYHKYLRPLLKSSL